jgi:2-methylcitrate dehydratase PrpD
MTATPTGLSDSISKFVAESEYDALPAATRNAAARVILDATGVMLAASGLCPEVGPFISLAREAATGPCTIFGSGSCTSAPMAAFANGAMAHALDFEDALDPAPGHPNAATIPAAVAIAQSGAAVDGRDIITAIAAGCDLACRIGLCLEQPLEENGWYPPPIIGAFGATAAVCRLLGLDALQTRDALSLVLCQATMPGEIKHSRRTIIRAVREAFPAQAAVIAGLLARDGVRGFEAPFEGEGGFFRLFADGRFDPDILTANLGQRFYIEELSFKPWPACRGTHAYIQLAIDLVREHRIDVSQVESVQAGIGSVHRMLVEPVAEKQAPASVIDAKFSIPFMLAVALVKGEVTLATINESTLRDPAVLAMASRVQSEELPGWGRERAASGVLSLELSDGRVFSGQVQRALGDPDAPLATERLVEKFVHCAGFASRPLEVAGAEALATRLLAIAASENCGAVFRS